MDPRAVAAASLALLGALAALAWLWLGRARGTVKRLAFRLALLALAGGLVWLGRAGGVFARASPGLAAVLGLTLLLVVIGNLYAVRFCARCGRMHRNFKVDACRRCGLALPRHGFTDRPRRKPLDLTDPLGRRPSRLKPG